MLKVASSKKKYHIVAAADTGTAEKNFINKDLGIIDDFGKLCRYNGNGSKDEKIPHILFHTSSGDKIIYVMGYGNKEKWKKALGGQYGCLYIDEANTADIDFVREAVMRADYIMMTLNPDDSNLPIYKEYINCSRPLPEYRNDAPAELNNMLCEEPKPGYVHWFFSFVHNAGLPKEKVDKIILNVPKGTKLYKNKVLGLRGKATGLIFSNFDRAHHVKTKAWAKQFKKGNGGNGQQGEFFLYYTIGIDTAYSKQSQDTIAFSFVGITNKGKCVVLDEHVYNNAQLGTPLAPSDTVRNLIDFAERNRKEWGFARNMFLDNADQATMMEWNKYKRMHGCIYTLNNAWKKVEIVDRINLQLGWLAYDEATGKEPYYYILDHCTHYISELELYSWDEEKDNTPEDKNDHMVNSTQYAWLPYEKRIGVKKE